MTVDSLVGAKIAGYRIEAQVGRGGMGRVYRAVQLSLGRPVALKILSAELAQDEGFRARFLKEAQLAATLEHPNILPIYEVGEDAGSLFMSMRLVEGTDLASLLQHGGPLSPARTLALLGQAADALDFAHRAGLVHRDVKPANLLLAGELLYLADFGVAKPVLARRELTHTGVFIGTLDYAAPEQIRNEPLDGAADLYALGCVLFQCLSGRVPFDRDTQFAVMQAHTAEPPPPLSALRPDLPVALDAVIATALAKQKDERFRSGRHLIEAARAAIDGRAPALAQTKIGSLMSLGIAPGPLVQPTLLSPQPPPTERATLAPASRPARRRGRGAQLGLALGIIASLIVGGVAAGAVLPIPDEARVRVAGALGLSAESVAALPIPEDARGFVAHMFGLAAGREIVVTAGPAPFPPAVSPAESLTILGQLCTSSVRTGETVYCAPSIDGMTMSTSYRWSVSGGSPSRSSDSGQYFETRFFSAGPATITLRACNGGACGTKSQTITVAPPVTAPPVTAPRVTAPPVTAPPVTAPTLTVADGATGGAQSASRTVAPGAVVQIWFNVFNSGTSTWQPGGQDGYLYRGTDQWAGRFWNVCCAIPPGGSDNFVVTMTAPQSPGRYRYGIFLTHRGTDVGPYFWNDITVYGPSRP